MLKNIFGLVNNTQNPTPNSPQYITNNKNTNISPETVKKMNVFYKLLDTVCAMLDDKQIPFYLDCGTLLGCIREGRLLLHDTDIDITIHLSRWEQLIESPDYYCDIYTNPAFPILSIGAMGKTLYPVPIDPGLYLKQLYGDWMTPSSGHADTDFHRNNGLILSEYRKNWDLRYNIYKCKF
jgi:hypothetical protein